MSWLDAAFRGLARAVFLPSVGLTAWVLTGATLPQGWWAEELLRFERYAGLRPYAAWGLTHAWDTPWVWALVVLGAGAVLAQAASRDLLARDAQRRYTLRAPRPELVADEAREALRAALGAPERAAFSEGATHISFRRSRLAALAPMNLGLIALLLGAALSLQPPAKGQMVAQAQLEVRDRRTSAVGTFDLMQGEQRTFFQDPREVTVAAYTPDREGLGPAVQLAALDPSTGRTERWWVYRDAPRGFDGRHRLGAVSIDVLDLQLRPRPGANLSRRSTSVLLLFGLVALALGFVSSGRPSGTWEVTLDGRGWVHIEATPSRAGKNGFFRATEDLVKNLSARVGAELPQGAADASPRDEGPLQHS